MAGTTMQMQNVSTVNRLFIMFLSVFYLCSYYQMITMLILYNVFTLIYLFITYLLLFFFFRSLLYSRLTSLGLMLYFLYTYRLKIKMI